jgi:dTDP-4-dehydrorhamnose 3,5-epimerase-like enzyme
MIVLVFDFNLEQPIIQAKRIFMRLSKCKIIELPKIQDSRGNLTFIENNTHIPFSMERIYYLYDVPGGGIRGGHAHKKLHQFIIAASGSFDVIIDDGVNKQKFSLNRSYYGLYVAPMMWRELENFSSGSVCIVLASEIYDESDYIRDYKEYKKFIEQNF